MALELSCDGQKLKVVRSCRPPQSAIIRNLNSYSSARAANSELNDAPLNAMKRKALPCLDEPRATAEAWIEDAINKPKCLLFWIGI
jgi:hypothetical protein